MGDSGSRSGNEFGASSELNSVLDLGIDYLRLCCEAMERVQMLTSPEQSRSLHLNQAQCKLLAEALSEAVQSAQQDIHGLDPSSVRLFAPALRELCRVAGDCESLVRDCCKENWIAVAILLADSRQVFELRVSELKWCARAWRIVREHGLQGGAWFEHFCKSSKPSMADRGRDMGGDTARWRIAFEEDLRTMRANLAEMQGNVDLDEEVRELAVYVMSRCKMIDGVQPDYEQASKIYELPKSSEPVLQHMKYPSNPVAKVTWFQESFAAKLFSDQDCDNEVAAMIKLSSHPRSVGFLGTVHSEWQTGREHSVADRSVHDMYIVMELLHSDLRHYLENVRREREGRKSSSDGLLPLHVAVDIMLQVAEGIQGFHKVRLFHGDVKSNNTLVQPVEEPVLREEGYVRVKLADFGLTQARSSIFYPGTGSTLWMAPELIHDGSEVSPLIIPAKADAYSFAILCYEILSGKLPNYLFGSISTWKDYVRGGGRPELPAALPSRLTSLVKSCWDMEPTKRPSFTAICKELRYLKFLLTIGGEVQFQALDGPDEVAKRLTAKIVKHLLWIDYRELHRIRHLGSGGYGSVDECEWRGQRVAVKNLLRCPTRKRVEEEAALLVRVEHSNVVKLIGCAFNEEDQKGMIVMELMDQDLHHLIRHNMRVHSPNAPPFSLPVALEMMLKVATAMKHIRSCNVLHRDLKTTNILVNAIRTGSSSQERITQEGSRYDVKLADFGLSKYKMGDSMFTTKASEAQFWRAPETSEAWKYSWPADVFSYGVVCYEILSGKKPFEEKQGPELLKLVRDGERPGIPTYCPTTVAELVNACWATNPAVRPEFAEICTKLEGCINVNRMSVAPAMAGH